jgi:hypothetical protein
MSIVISSAEDRFLTNPNNLSVGDGDHARQAGVCHCGGEAGQSGADGVNGDGIAIAVEKLIDGQVPDLGVAGADGASRGVGAGMALVAVKETDPTVVAVVLP